MHQDGPRAQARLDAFLMRLLEDPLRLVLPLAPADKHEEHVEQLEHFGVGDGAVQDLHCTGRQNGCA